MTLVESLIWLRLNGAVLEHAPVNTAAAIDHRRLDEVHVCLLCGQRAQAAYIAQTEGGPRWLDLCWADAHKVRQVAAGLREDDLMGGVLST